MKSAQNNKKRILIVGDVMLDVYHFGRVDRISPEAPVPVFLETGHEKSVAGGAANVAVNIAAIDVETDLCTIVGADDYGRRIIELLEEKRVGIEYVLIDKGRPTTTKLRYIGPNNQQIMRADAEKTDEISTEQEAEILNKVKERINEFCLILISDYCKGFLSKKITKKIIEMGNSNSIPVLIDVKENDLEKYKDATLLKPNRKELTMLTGMNTDSIEDAIKAAVWLCKEGNVRYVLTTLGSEGMILVDKDGLIEEVRSTSREVFDVTGAGDTSIAYLAAEIARGKDIKEAMIIANYAAGVQVSKVGTSVVYPYEVYDAMRGAGLPCGVDDYPVEGAEKLESIRQRKKSGEKIVFTNGCFDILHSGHVIYLKEAKKLGDVLVIGLNSDDSIKRLKGEERPVNTYKDRELVLSALSFVDYVIPFEEDTPINLIENIVPDVLVKGGDYTPKDIVGADVVLNSGGDVMVIPFVPGHSTSDIIKKIKKE